MLADRAILSYLIKEHQYERKDNDSLLKPRPLPTGATAISVLAGWIGSQAGRMRRREADAASPAALWRAEQQQADHGGTGDTEPEADPAAAAHHPVNIIRRRRCHRDSLPQLGAARNSLPEADGIRNIVLAVAAL